MALAIILVFFAGFLTNALLLTPRTAQQQPAVGSNVQEAYPLINPAVTMHSSKHFIVNFQPLKTEIQDIQNQYPQKTYIYFLYLNSGVSIGLNEHDDFTAASTVKVPLAMAVLRAVEEGKMQLTDTYSLTSADLDDRYGNLYQAGVDATFTTDQLLKIMLENSDNTAMNALFSMMANIGISSPLTDVYQSFGWVFDVGVTPTFNEIDAKTLSTMFVALYNATYLNVDHSEEILNYLDQSSFDDKIVSGVPVNISVAHKIGISEPDQTFSDCGIVYASNRNYLLCVASAGAPEDQATQFVSSVSKAIYDYVISH